MGTQLPLFASAPVPVPVPVAPAVTVPVPAIASAPWETRTKRDIFGSPACAGPVCHGPQAAPGAAPTDGTTEERQAHAQAVLNSLPHAPGCGGASPQWEPEIEHDMGGAYTLDKSIPCIQCGRWTLVRIGVHDDGKSSDRSADPRGVCGLQARVRIIAEEYGFAIGDDAYACWECFEEKGRVGQQKVLDKAARAKGWRSASVVGAPASVPDGLPSRAIGEDVLRVLSACSIDGARVKLPGAQLERKLYERVNEVLEALGGKWNKRAKAHLFDESPADVLDAAITSGRIVLPKDLGWFPTPDALAMELVERADVRPGMLCLEPSAGEGAIARALRAAGANVMCRELDPGRVAKLRGDGFTCAQGDFLELPVERIFNRVVMNPPFGKRADVVHVKRAFEHLHPGGRLVSVMAGGVLFRQDRLATEFRALVEASNGSIDPLPEGSFVESGTGVRTVVVTMTRAA